MSLFSYNEIFCGCMVSITYLVEESCGSSNSDLFYVYILCCCQGRVWCLMGTDLYSTSKTQSASHTRMVQVQVLQLLFAKINETTIIRLRKLGMSLFNYNEIFCGWCQQLTWWRSLVVAAAAICFKFTSFVVGRAGFGAWWARIFVVRARPNRIVTHVWMRRFC